MAAAVYDPLFFGKALLPHYFWKSSNDRYLLSKMELGILPLVVKFSNEAASNGCKVPKLCPSTGTNSISNRPDFLFNSSCTGTSLVMCAVISGYWVGPDDDEQECGYIQALVQRIN